MKVQLFFFSEKKKKHVDHNPGPGGLKRKLDQDIITLNVCVKLNQNQPVNEDERAMTIFFLKIITVTLTLTLECLKRNLSQDITILNIYVE